MHGCIQALYGAVAGLVYMAHPMLAGMNYKDVHSPAQGLDVWCLMHKGWMSERVDCTSC